MTVPVGRHGAQEGPAARMGHALRTLLRPARVPHRIWEYTVRQFAVATLAGVAVIVLSIIFVDGAVIRSMPRLPDTVRQFFEWFTDFGRSGVFLWPLGIAILLLALVPRGRLNAMQQGVVAALTVRAGFLFLALAVPGLLIAVVKRLVGRARPMVLETVDPLAFLPFVKWSASYASLPSGHATTAFSVLIAAGTLWPRMLPLLWVYAVAIAVSRIAVTAHYPSDVLAGAVAGTLGALIVRRYFALRHLAFSIDPSGGFHVRPGPSPRRIKAVARRLWSE